MRSVGPCCRILAAVSCLSFAACYRSPVSKTAVLEKSPAAFVVREFAVPVLMYHRVTHLSDSEHRSPLARDLTVSPEDFEEQVRYLHQNGFSLLSVYDVQEALLNRSPLPERAVAITMDDGYRDNFENAYPILKRYGASATIFLVKNTVGSYKHLTWPQILAMRPNGVRYGSHSVSHPDLPKLDDRRLAYELEESKAFLEKGLGEAVTALAYPAGRFDDRVVEAVRRSGYLTGWKKGGGPVRPDSDPLRLPRVRVRGGTSFDEFARKVWSGVWTMRMRDSRVVRSKRSGDTVRVSS